MDPLERARNLSLEEKIALLSGAGYWETKANPARSIPALRMADGPHGLRVQGSAADHLGLHSSVRATCFPTASALAASWDAALLREIGQALGREARALGVNILLGPGVNIKRNPLCGRNFEYFSEDPFLSGHLATAWIHGVQSQGVGASLKHFACNNQETKRMVSDSLVDERALRELYLPAFEMAVKQSAPATLMCAYNQLNGVYCSDNRRLLWDILRGEWGFRGAVISDWGATHDRVAGVRAGMDLEMPGSQGRFDQEIEEALQDGRLDEAALDGMAARLIALADRWQMEGAPDLPGQLFDEHHQLARKAAAAGAILLKNEGALLPLAPQGQLTVIGEMARTPRYQGNGSSLVSPTCLVSLLDGLTAHGVTARFAPGYRLDGQPDEALISQALGMVKPGEPLVLCLGLTDLDESEGYDRQHLSLPQNQLALLERVRNASEKVVVVLSGGSAIELPWEGQAAAILHLQLAGQAGGQAAADLLLGYQNPSGKLAESYPLAYSDVAGGAAYGQTAEQVPYLESLFVGYRYYDSAAKPVRYPFGHGLSYTTFEYSKLSVSHLGGCRYAVRFSVKNTGPRAGAETAQLYVRAETGGACRPRHELKGFAKVHLGPGQEKEVLIQLDERSFAIYDPKKAAWVVEAGQYTLEAGAGSRDIRLAHTISPEGVAPAHSPAANWYSGLQGQPTLEDFKTIHPGFQPFVPAVKGGYTLDNSLRELAKTSLVSQILLRVMERLIARGSGGKVDYHNPQFRMLMDAASQNPLRSLPLFSPEMMPLPRAKLILDIANGRLLAGLRDYFRRTRRKKP